MTSDDRIAIATEHLRARGLSGPFAAALILGTGLGDLVHDVEDGAALPYSDVPGFPRAGVSGHAGAVIAGRLGGRRVLVFAGRAHPYEKGDTAAMDVPIAAAAALGAPVLLVSSASGSLRPEVGPGSLVAVSDHIGIGMPNPLVGKPGDGRFVSMTDAYCPALRAGLAAAASRVGLPVREGVYMWFSGPSFETPAEIRAARMLGADLVGMSTVPEVILARHRGMRVAAVSLVTNHAAGLATGALAHDETKRVGREAGPRFRELVATFLSGLDPV